MDGHTLSTVPATQITLTQSKQLVETYLDDYFAKKLCDSQSIDPSYARLWTSVHNLYKAGGKRLRPYVTLLSFQAHAPTKDLNRIVPAAAAQELLHLAMLIHDDIIDRDRVRYGIANVAGQYDEIYAGQIEDITERKHFADSAAILAGDLLLSDAYWLLSKCDMDPSLILQVQRILNTSVYSVIGGELLDTEAAFSDKATLRPLEIARLKTASYSFVSPLLMGATFAEADEKELTLLQTLGETIGIAYQLQDDILGMFGDSQSTGKSVTSDLSEDKYTYLVQLFYALASDSQKTSYQDYTGVADISDEQADVARQLLVDSGAKAKLETKIEQLCSDARGTIEALSVEDRHKQSFKELLAMAVRRVK